MKKSIVRLLSAGMCAAMVLSACGNSGSGSLTENAGYMEEGGSFDYKGLASEDMAAEDVSDTEQSSAAAQSDENGETGSTRAKGNGDTTVDESAKKLDDKLVYYGDVSIDTLDFDKSVSDFKKLIAGHGGYIENETFSDGDYYDYSYDYVPETDKKKRYNATVRIPSDRFEEVTSSMGELGDVRSESKRTDNFSQEYSDLSIKLDILNQTYDRYSALMESAKDEDYILALQEKMTDLSIEIEQTKSRMNRIDTDVKYSYLDITIKEVYKYENSTTSRSTFAQRLLDTFSDTWVGFLDFLEGLLFLIIHLLPYAVIIAVIVVIIRKIIKKKHAKDPNYVPGKWKEKLKSVRKKKPVKEKTASAENEPEKDIQEK